MHNLLLTFVTLGICFGCTLGDVKCFLTNIGKCSTLAGMPPAGLTGIFRYADFCKQSKTFVECFREKNTQCSTQYNLDEVEKMYNDICTDGSPMNGVFVRYQKCIQKSLQSHLSCSKGILDFMGKFKDFTPDVKFQITKQVCKERDNISNCVYNSVLTDCGNVAKVILDVISQPYNKVNNKICQDALQIN